MHFSTKSAKIKGENLSEYERTINVKDKFTGANCEYISHVAYQGS